MLGLWLVHVILCFYFPGSCEEMEEEEEDDEGVQGHQKAITESKVKGQEDEVVEGQLEKEQQKTDQPIETRDKTFLTEVSGVTNKSRVTIVTPTREDTRQGKVYFIRPSS